MLRDIEEAKIQCGEEHFKALEQEDHYVKASNYGNFVDQAISKVPKTDS